jgi:purine nucleosidase/non-specific riboncleoside hydrolase
MGGTVWGRGNTTPAAEFNVYADPEAAAVVFAAGLDMIVVPWEPCTTHFMTGAEIDLLFDSLPDNDYKTFSQTLASHARQNLDENGKGDFFRFVDPLAAAVAIDPGIVRRSVRASVDVALAPGITRGMTVVDPSGRLGTPPVTVVEEASLERLVSLYAASVSYLR